MSAPAASMNSTNVRNMSATNLDPRAERESGRTLAVALAVWAAVIAGADIDDTFGKFAAAGLVAFAAGIALYAFAAYRIDREIRAYILDFSRRALVAAALAALGSLAAALAQHIAALAVFTAPIAAVATAAAVEKLAARPRKARAKSPAATPAAT